MFESLTAYLDSYLAMGIPYYDCEIRLHGERVYRHKNGFLDPEKTKPVTGEEVTNFYSCSKLVTVTAAMQLWEKGAFRLNDRLGDYLPEFAEMDVKTPEGVKKCEKPILIKHLFEMSAGFSYEVSPRLRKAVDTETDGGPTREAIRLFAREPLCFEPGAMWKYSACHDVLAALVEVLSGQRFGLYVKEHIFDVCGMKRSTFWTPDVDPADIAQQYEYDPVTMEVAPTGPHIHSVFNFGRFYESGGAGLRSTVDDYMAFLEGLRTGRLLKKETLALMSINRFDSNRPYTFGSGAYGYGLGMKCPVEGGRFTDFGWGGKAGQVVLVDLIKDFTVVYSQHVSSPPNASIKSRIIKYVNDGIKEIGG